MAKETMLSYLDTQLNKKLSEYDIAIDWDTKNHTIEVMFRLFAENKTQLSLDDAEGVTSEEEVIEFEDGIIFYDQTKSKLDAEDFLATLAFEGKKGVSKATIHALVRYLPEILTTGQDELMDFLMSEEIEVFELKFDQEVFNRYVNEESEHAKSTFLPYPSY